MKLVQVKGEKKGNAQDGGQDKVSSSNDKPKEGLHKAPPVRENPVGLQLHSCPIGKAGELRVLVSSTTDCCPNAFSLFLKRLLTKPGLAPGDFRTRPLDSTSWNCQIFCFTKMCEQKTFQ
jgi:hypothetical protein